MGRHVRKYSRHVRKYKGRRASDARTFAVLCLISFAISILAWSATLGAGV